MASSLEYVEFVVSQIDDRFRIRYGRLFGQYCIYVNEKPALLVCDNTVYAKMLGSLKELLSDAETGYPFDGAREHYILDVENYELFNEALGILERELPFAKKKKRAST